MMLRDNARRRHRDALSTQCGNRPVRLPARPGHSSRRSSATTATPGMGVAGLGGCQLAGAASVGFARDRRRRDQTARQGATTCGLEPRIELACFSRPLGTTQAAAADIGCLACTPTQTVGRRACAPLWAGRRRPRCRCCAHLACSAQNALRCIPSFLSTLQELQESRLLLEPSRRCAEHTILALRLHGAAVAERLSFQGQAIGALAHAMATTAVEATPPAAAAAPAQ